MVQQYGRMTQQQESGGFKYLTAGGIVGGVGVLFTLAGSFYTVDQTQRAVLLRNGAYIETVQPGLHFKWPWIESYTKIDMQTHTHAWNDMETYSKDQQPAHLKVSVTLHVAPDKVEDLYSRFRGDNDAAIARIIGPHVAERTKDVFGQYNAAQAINERASLNVDVGKALSQAIAYDPVFSIESVQVENIVFSPDYIKSIEDRMKAEVEVQKLKQNLEREKVQADIAYTQADGQARAIKTKADADAYATRARGNAEAEAINARSNALKSNEGIIELTKAERWNGVLPTSMIPGSAVPFMQLNK